MIIRDIKNEDISPICKSYKVTFNKEHFSIHFPQKLLEKYFLELINNFEFNRILTTGDGKITGYLIGGKNPNPAFNDFIKKNVLKILLVFLLHPKFIVEKLFEILSNLRCNKNDLEFDQNTLCLIGIDKFEQGKGYAHLLINDFEKQLSSKNIKSYFLAVRKSNILATKFYENNGFEKLKSTNHMHYFRKQIS
jgi:ribosomal protein S18 acetylase RimI-like enzyme